MKKGIHIPETDLSLCPIGMGTLGAGIRWDGKEADAIFGTYLDMGGNVVDTARIYQDWIPGEVGRSERVVGDWLRRSGKRNEIILMTKGGHPKYTQPGDDLHISRMTPADMRHDLELSLQALGTDVIDIYFYHRDNTAQPIGEVMETMRQFVKEGKIRYFACSNWTAGRMREADAYCREHGFRGFVADQTFLNIGMRHMNPLADDTLSSFSDEIADYHRCTPGNLTMAYYASANGFFQRYLKDAAVKDSTYGTDQNKALAQKIKAMAEKYDTGITQIVLGYVFAQCCECLALYGPSSPERMREAMRTLDCDFSKKDFEEMLL
ncbi:MAG: aldo/keto reductase [Blautia sp.]|nr:aldo/keto reductase [Blautia sp.]